MTALNPMIVSDPNIMMGKLVIADTGSTVKLISEKLAEGKKVEQILQAHPQVTFLAIDAALAFTSEVLRADGGNNLRFRKSVAFVPLPDRPRFRLQGSTGVWGIIFADL
jgi:uncharacterized protein (DUF433 family)